MMNECEKNAGLMMRIASPDSVRNRRFAVSSEIPRHVLFASCAGKKNGMWGLREDSANVLRSQGVGSSQKGYHFGRPVGTSGAVAARSV